MNCPVQQQQQYGGRRPATRTGRRAGDHGSQWQAVDRHGDRHHRRQGAHSRGPDRQHPECDRRRHPGDMLMIDPKTRQPPRGSSARASRGAVADVEASSAARRRTVGQRDRRQYHPAGKLDGWRRQVNCLFGLAINGQPMTSTTRTTRPVLTTARRVPMREFLWTRDLVNFARTTPRPTLIRRSIVFRWKPS